MDYSHFEILLYVILAKRLQLQLMEHLTEWNIEQLTKLYKLSSITKIK